MRPSDKSLVDTALRAVQQLSLQEAGDTIGVSHETIARWRNGDWKRLNPPTRRAVQEFIEMLGLSAEEDSRISRNGSASTEAPRSRRVGELIEMLAQKDALRRMARTISDKDLVTSAYAIAIDDGWTEEEMQQLDAWRREILGGETNAG